MHDVTCPSPQCVKKPCIRLSLQTSAYAGVAIRSLFSRNSSAVPATGLLHPFFLVIANQRARWCGNPFSFFAEFLRGAGNRTPASNLPCHCEPARTLVWQSVLFFRDVPPRCRQPSPVLCTEGALAPLEGSSNRCSKAAYGCLTHSRAGSRSG